MKKTENDHLYIVSGQDILFPGKLREVLQTQQRSSGSTSKATLGYCNNKLSIVRVLLQKQLGGGHTTGAVQFKPPWNANIGVKCFSSDVLV